MDERRRTAGPFFIMPFEVYHALWETEYPQACRDLYEAIMVYLPIKEDWDRDPVWVVGRFTASKPQLSRFSRMSEGHLYRVWTALRKANLIDEDFDGSFVLPKYKKKADAPLSASQIASIIERLEATEQESANTRQELKEIKEILLMYEEKAQILSKGSESTILTHEGNSLTHEGNSLTHEGPILLKEKKDHSLSGNNVISGFYRGIEQKKISKSKRERANNVLKKLREDGFTLEDIAFAVEWTLKNAKEQLYDFSIIEHTIGQAIAAKEREEAESKEIEERQRKAAEARERQEREEKEREEIESYKESLSSEEREALRKRAETELRESGQFREEYITDLLIEIKENQILREEIAGQADEDQENNV